MQADCATRSVKWVKFATKALTVEIGLRNIGGETNISVDGENWVKRKKLARVMLPPIGLAGTPDFTEIHGK